MFLRKDLESMTYRALGKLAHSMNNGGYSIVISKNKNELILNILNAFVVQSGVNDGTEYSVRIKRIRGSDKGDVQ
jgi:hypothetical protein